MLAHLAQTPDTSIYMIAGYVVFIVVPAVFIATLIARSRSLRQDEAALKSLGDEETKNKPA
ncbi:MAG: hypothetical protein HY679_02590 [Chloroflexi bacterium]|nr:hypothetical protein [Chloroflexota bacterium]